MELRRRGPSPGGHPPRRRARVLPPPSRVTAEDIIAPSAQPPQSSRSAVCEMAPSPPPALMDDAIGEILLRLPPSDPACLVRASLVCKPWLRLLSDRNFLRRYRAFHQTPPMLGFFHKYDDCSTVRGFVPTTQASLPVPHMAPAGYILDCWHGRVLLQTSQSKSSRLVVWDPITGEQQSFSSPVHPNNCFATAVLCGSHGCDHLECGGGPFRVAIVGAYWQDGHIGGTLGSVYSSETATWSAPVYVNPMSLINCATSSLLVGDTLYFSMELGVGIIKYDLAEGVVSVINMMPSRQNMCLATAEDGGLGVAALKGNSLHLWSWRNDPNGAGEWVQGRVIKLDAMIPMRASDPFNGPCVIGFAEGTDNIFISSNDGTFIVELRSGRTRKICKKGYVHGSILPFTSFYTPDLASASLQRSMRD